MDFITYEIRGIEEQGGKWSYGALTRKQIESLNTPFLVACLGLYSDYSVFKVLPHGKGTMDERGTVLEILKILKGEENAFNAWELEKKTKRSQ